MIQGTTNVWSCECRIAHVKNPMTLGNVGYGTEIRQRERRIRGTFTEDQLGIWLNCILDNLWIGKIHKAKSHSQWNELFTTDAVRTTVTTVGNDAVISRLHERINAGCSGRHSRRHTDGIVSIFDFGNLLLEHLNGGVVRTAVTVSLVEVLVDGFLNEGGGHVDGCENGASLFIGCNSTVHDMGVHGTVGDPAFAAKGTAGDGDVGGKRRCTNRIVAAAGSGAASVAAITAASVEIAHP